MKYRKKSIKIKKIVMPIYRQSITLGVSKNLENLTKKLNIHEEDLDYKKWQAITVRTRNKNGYKKSYLLFDNKNLELKNIVHEVAHLCIWICRDLDIKIEANNDEPFAYMVEYTFNEICKFLNIKTNI